MHTEFAQARYARIQALRAGAGEDRTGMVLRNSCREITSLVSGRDWVASSNRRAVDLLYRLGIETAELAALRTRFRIDTYDTPAVGFNCRRSLVSRSRSLSREDVHPDLRLWLTLFFRAFQVHDVASIWTDIADISITARPGMPSCESNLRSSGNIADHFIFA
jgi:hypothetical protein